MKDLLLPRKYLSYSQMTCWISNKPRFRKEYFEGGRKLNTKYLAFGKSMAETRSQRDLKPGQQTELKLMVEIQGVPVLSFIDFYDGNIHEFEEDKTGKIPWTQAKVQKHEQLPYYAAVLRAKFGVLPKKCKLNWFETEEDVPDKDDFWAKVEKKVLLTGKSVSFEREFDEREIDRVEKLIVKTAWEISDAYKKFIGEI